jgi:N-acetylglucosaminyldiphosphoundecaprenol N-acetyl-beta-D-mannosaminyltransferase
MHNRILNSQTAWPRKASVFGVQVSVTNYDEATNAILAAAHRRQGGAVTFLPVHGIVTGATDRSYRDRVNGFDMIGPDGQPVRWALNVFQKAALTSRVYGPEQMLRVCRASAEQGVSVYLYGSTDEVLGKLTSNLMGRFPALKIAGVESPPFRKLSADEMDAAVDRINASGAGILFVGLGCPRQEVFASETRRRIKAVQLCVGAAFDFHAGNKKTAPAFMQRFGMEWLFRLTQEPQRLWKRYLVTNSIFVTLFGIELLKHLFFGYRSARPSQTAMATVSVR